MRKIERAAPLALLAAAVIGAVLGLLAQLIRSRIGQAPLVPPWSLPVSLAVIGGVLVALGVQLRRGIAHRPGAVNPFHAVRLLAAARAAQFVGALFGGVGLGMLLSLAGRSVPAPVATWLPMLSSAIGGAVLLGCALMTERLCRVPPRDDDRAEDEDAPEPGPADQPAYRKP